MVAKFLALKVDIDNANGTTEAIGVGATIVEVYCNVVVKLC